MTVSMRTPTFEDVYKRSSTYVHGKIIGDINIYEVELPSTGNTALDEKRAANGISNTAEFYEYTLSVINDTENVYSKNDIIKITANTLFLDYNGRLSDGIEIVVPLGKKRNGNRVGYQVTGMHYVTDDGYVISAYDEASRKQKTSFNGIKVEELMKKLKK